MVSSRCPAYDQQLTEARWAGITRSPPRSLGAGTLAYHAKLHGWTPPPSKPWSAAGYFLTRCGPRRGWRTFKRWCAHKAEPPIPEERAEQIFRAILEKDLLQ